MGKNCSHDVIGICFGYFYIGCSVVGFVFSVFSVVHDVFHSEPKFKALLPALFFAFIAFISFLFVLAIETKRPLLIFPWLAFGLFVCYITGHLSYEALNFLGFSVISIVISLPAVFEIAVVINGCILLVKISREYKRSREAWDRRNIDTYNNTLVGANKI